MPRTVKHLPYFRLADERYRDITMAFDALGNLIAKVSGVRFEEYIRIKILDPIGMIDSSFQSSIGIWICHRLGRRSRRGWYGHHRHDTAKCCVRILIWIEAMYRAGLLRSSRRYPAESGRRQPRAAAEVDLSTSAHASSIFVWVQLIDDGDTKMMVSRS